MGAEDSEQKPLPPPEIKFEIPSWAGKPASGMHLDVVKEDKGLIQKLMIDEKRAYYFGRNPAQCDFTVDHASASRVHAVLIYHPPLHRAFLVDLGSTHGTFIGKSRLEHRKPEQIQPGQSFHFGASTRTYVLREKPTSSMDDQDSHNRKPGSLPTKDEELENLTEYNTALNRRIGTLATVEEPPQPNRKRKRLSVFFNDDEDVINPEDIDPTIGRFRNLVATTVIRKRAKGEEPKLGVGVESGGAKPVRRVRPGEPDGSEAESGPGLLGSLASASLGLGLSLPNPAPDIQPELYAAIPTPASTTLPLQKRKEGVMVGPAPEPGTVGPKKKKYAKEAWPGRKKEGPTFL